MKDLLEMLASKKNEKKSKKGAKKIEARMKAINSLRGSLPEMQKITVAAKDKKGLTEGLDTAKKLLMKKFK